MTDQTINQFSANPSTRDVPKAIIRGTTFAALLLGASMLMTTSPAQASRGTAAMAGQAMLQAESSTAFRAAEAGDAGEGIFRSAEAGDAGEGAFKSAGAGDAGEGVFKSA